MNQITEKEEIKQMLLSMEDEIDKAEQSCRDGKVYSEEEVWEWINERFKAEFNHSL